jgi:hypothetical protein
LPKDIIYIMERINHQINQEEVQNTMQPDQIITNVNQMPDIVLKRLMDEVKNDNVNQMFAYDRAHNRHNRGR